MDGLQRKIKHSLQFKLSAWLSLAILGIALAAGAFSFVSAFWDANELQDDQLRQIAALVNRGQVPMTPAEAEASVPGIDAEARVIVQELRKPGSQAPATSDEVLALRAEVPDGLQTVSAHDEPWRVFVKTLDSGSRIAVAQQTAVRNEIARDSALRTLMPFVMLVPILLLLVGVLIGQMFKPVRKLASELDHRPQQDLGPLSETHLPSEILPFVVAINRLLSRVARSVALQRRFVADAAHELRSPLTALSLQAERLAAADMSVQARERLATLRDGLQRARVLLHQLWTLARVQEPPNTAIETVSVQHVFREVLEDLMPLAQAKNIDLGVVGESDACVAAQEVDLKTLVKNLVDNAIRYTPQGGRIDLSVTTRENRVVLQVDDTGPGIPEEERERVFDPFYRVLGNDEVGSGLGLSIVKTITARIGADLGLGSSDKPTIGSGLRATVIFPVTSTPWQGDAPHGSPRSS